MRIRLYNDSDAESVIKLWQDVFGYTAPHNDPQFVIQQKRAVQPDLFFVAAIGSQIAGTIMGGYDGHRGWIYSLAVLPEARRQGVGGALVRHVERALLDRGCPKVNLQVLATNPQVISFYKSLGYAVEERISMGKLLS